MGYYKLIFSDNHLETYLCLPANYVVAVEGGIEKRVEISGEERHRWWMDRPLPRKSLISSRCNILRLACSAAELGTWKDNKKIVKEIEKKKERKKRRLNT